MALFSPRGCRTWKEGNCTGRYAYWWISKSLSEWQYKNACKTLYAVFFLCTHAECVLVSMRPLVMLLDGGPATFLAQNKSTGFVITTNVSWYKSSPLLIWLQHPLDLCYHRRLYSTCLWHLTCCYAYVVLSCMSMRPRGKVFLFDLRSNSGSSTNGQISFWLLYFQAYPSVSSLSPT